MNPASSFSALSRVLHWTMAVLILVMLFIGIGMVTTSSRYQTLVSIHRPLGAAILLLVALRLVNRLLTAQPPLPQGMPWHLRVAAHASHVALYALMFAVPLAGWSMLSAGGYPVELFGPLRLPPIAPHNMQLYAALRHAHTILALLLFATFLLHLGAALMHALIYRDGVFASMATLKVKPGADSQPPSGSEGQDSNRPRIQPAPRG
jgi:cytochrome b561